MGRYQFNVKKAVVDSPEEKVHTGGRTNIWEQDDKNHHSVEKLKTVKECSSVAVWLVSGWFMLFNNLMYRGKAKKLLRVDHTLGSWSYHPAEEKSGYTEKHQVHNVCVFNRTWSGASAVHLPADYMLPPK